MTKNIILQHFDGELRELDKLSMSNIKAYADMVGADYRFIEGKPFNTNLTPACQKVYIIDEIFDEYDQVLMLDIDMFAPKNMSENIFDKTGVGVHNSTQERLQNEMVRFFHPAASLKAPYWGGAIYKMSRGLRKALRAARPSSDNWMYTFNRQNWYEDEGIIHVLANRAGISTNNAYLDNKWCQCSFLPNPEKAGFIHIRTKIAPDGPKRTKIENYNGLVEAGIL